MKQGSVHRYERILDQWFRVSFARILDSSFLTILMTEEINNVNITLPSTEE
jgi:hypothetical protein